MIKYLFLIFNFEALDSIYFNENDIVKKMKTITLRMDRETGEPRYIKELNALGKRKPKVEACKNDNRPSQSNIDTVKPRYLELQNLKFSVWNFFSLPVYVYVFRITSVTRSFAVEFFFLYKYTNTPVRINSDNHRSYYYLDTVSWSLLQRTRERDRRRLWPSPSF